MTAPVLAAPRPADEAERLAALDTLGLLSPYPEENIERIARLAARVMGTPAAGFSLVGAETQWFKAGHATPYETVARDGSLCAWAIAGARALVVPDARHDARFAGSPLVTGPVQLRFYAGVPVRDLAGHALGALAVFDQRPRRPGPGIVQALEDLAALLERELWLKALSVLDPLTGLYNRRFFDDYARREWLRARRELAPVSVVMFDLDHFGAFNQALGHDAGDHALRAFGALLRQAPQRGGDVVARYGGEEFVMVLPRTDAAGARVVAERVRARLHALDLRHPGSSTAPTLTVSAGVATLEKGTFERLEAVLKRADDALFAAKTGGRDQVCVSPARAA